MLFRLPAEVLILLIPVLLFSLCFHEFSHAYSAYKLGDETAYRMGRLTLHPLAHLDPMGTLMILFVGFGWAKPVPVNPINLENPRSCPTQLACLYDPERAYSFYIQLSVGLAICPTQMQRATGCFLPTHSVA